MKKSIFAVVLIGLASLAACAKIRYPNYYVLNIPSAPSAVPDPPPISGTAAVREFRAPQYLRQGPIAYRPDPEQVAFYDYDHWAEDPRGAATTAVLRELQMRGIFQSAALFDGRASADFLITGSLDHLEEVDRGNFVSVEVGLSAKLEDLKTGEIVWSGSSSKTSTVEQRSVSGVVAEMSRNLNDAANQLVISMQKQAASRISASR